MNRIVLPRLSPFEVLLLVVSAILGASYVVGTPPPTSVAASQPGWMIHAWAVGLLFSGVTGLAGCFWLSHLERALRLEAAGMCTGAATMMLYAVALFSYSGWRAFGSGLTFGMWAAANLWRWWQISRTIRALQ